LKKSRTTSASDSLQISAALNHNSLQLFIDGRPFALQELGAGLAQFIVVLGNAALKKPSFILIDEPEISLHPSLQLKFLMKLAGYASEGVVFATHNIGLARSVAEEIYSVSAAAKGKRDKKNRADTSTGGATGRAQLRGISTPRIQQGVARRGQDQRKSLC